MIIALLIVGGAVSFFVLVPPLNVRTTANNSSTESQTRTTCATITPARGEALTAQRFGAVTEFALPSPLTSPNAITVAPDGSVWFGENGLPGVGHLSPNGTLEEYRLPFSHNSLQNSCGNLAYIWGVALWNGSVWAANEDQPQLEGVNPSTGAITNVTLRSQTSPYTLEVGPDGDLWFTMLAGGPEIGRVTPGADAVQYLRFPGNDSWSSAYVTFANSTLGYVLAINPTLAAYPNAITSIVYSFNPEQANPNFTQVGSNTTLYEPASIAVGEGGLWLTEHLGTGMAFFNTTSSAWTIYPTSTVPYVPYTLTYFDASNGTAVWFNEHYGDKISMISKNGTQLTEYAVSDPPVENLSLIPNTLTMAIGGGRTWFTQWTGNIVGFVNQTYTPPFSVTTQNTTSVELRAGGSTQIHLQVSGQDQRNLSIQFSDNEVSDSTPENITFSPSVTAFRSLNGPQTITVDISAKSDLKPGDYIAAVTLTDGLVLRSVYVSIVVTE